MSVKKSSSVEPAQQTGLLKPEADVKRIIECLLPVASQIVMPESDGVINLKALFKNEGSLPVLLLLKGQINFLRISAGGLLFGSAQAPSVLGLLGSSLRFDTFKYVSVAGSNVHVLTRDEAIDLIHKSGLIREVLDYHAYISDMETKNSNRLINKTTYEMVITLLSDLAELPDEVRLKTSVAQFILDRSKMGRSGMMRILADLRKGEYVDIQNGKLIKILRNFPKVY